MKKPFEYTENSQQWHVLQTWQLKALQPSIKHSLGQKTWDLMRESFKRKKVEHSSLMHYVYNMDRTQQPYTQ